MEVCLPQTLYMCTCTCGTPQALELAKQMLGQTLVTKQTGPAGKPVNTLYIAQKMKLKREMYFAILLDRKTSGPIMIGCRWVGMCPRKRGCQCKLSVGGE